MKPHEVLLTADWLTRFLNVFYFYLLANLNFVPRNNKSNIWYMALLALDLYHQIIN